MSELSRVRRKKHRPRDAEVVSRVMRAVKSRNNRSERELRRALSKRRLRYRLQVAWLPGKPDLVFHRSRVAVFVDGDFWHARIFVEKGLRALRASLRTERREWWIRKLLRNVERDLLATAALQGLGYAVVRVWERDVRTNATSVAASVARIVKRRTA